MSTIKIKWYDDSVMVDFYEQAEEGEEGPGCSYAVIPAELWKRYEDAQRERYTAEEEINQLIREQGVTP